MQMEQHSSMHLFPVLKQSKFLCNASCRVLLESESFTNAVYIFYTTIITYCFAGSFNLLFINNLLLIRLIVHGIMSGMLYFNNCFTGIFVTSYLIYNCQAAPFCFLSLICLLQTRQYKDVPLYIYELFSFDYSFLLTLHILSMRH
jgi:hypothetical protein